MPYIRPDDRRGLEIESHSLAQNIQTSGELNYCISKIIHTFLEKKKFILSYEDYNSVIGVLECAKLELYKQVVSKYEDRKKVSNGAVSDLDSVSLEDVR